MGNPFKYGEIIGKENFCNRKTELKDVTSAMRNGDRLILFSERRMGKTSLVRLALDELPKSKYLTSYIDLWPTLNARGFAQTLAIRFTRDFASKKDDLLRTARELFGHLRPEVTFAPDGSPKLSFSIQATNGEIPELEEILMLPSHISARFKKQVVVVLDEIQQIFEYEDDYVEKALRSAIQNQAGVAFILLGSRKHMIQRMVLDRNRPLYRAGTIYPLSNIAAEHWLPYIRARFDDTQKPIGDDVILELCQLTEGHPYYTQHLCHALWEMHDDIHELENIKLVGSAFSTVLGREHAVFSSQWESLTRNQKFFLHGLSIEGPRPRVHQSDFIQRWELKSSSNIQRIVEALLKKDIIDQDNGSYLISDRFFREWIRREEYRF